MLTAAFWLSTGTLAPYAATLNEPLALPPCNYLYNIDHGHFEATYFLLDGRPAQYWASSVVLRRLLFPVLAFPFMKWLGFASGGVLTSLLLHWAAFALLVWFAKRTIGVRGAVAAAWLFATYPGITYCCGLPYSYAAIVPFTVAALVLVRYLARTESMMHALLLALGIGVAATAYDLLPIFGGAVLLIALARRRPLWLPGMVIALVAPSALIALWLTVGKHVPLLNANNAVYSDYVATWLHPSRPKAWAALLIRLPELAIRNYVYCAFVFLPFVFAGMLVLNRLGPRLPLELPERCILVAALFLFLLVNAAPPFPPEKISPYIFAPQLRGDGWARLYQGIFVVMLVFSARVVEATSGRWLGAAVALCALAVLGNASVAFGPALRVPYAGDVYIGFYRHSPPEALQRNLDHYGRRPLGFCRPQL